MFQVEKIFSDHMILQREKNVRIFGLADPNKTIRVSIPERDIIVETTTQKDCCWMAIIPPCTVGEPCTVEVTDGAETIQFQDVLFGEVWLAGGQSNMEFAIKDTCHGAQDLEECENSQVRFFHVPRNTFKDGGYEAEWSQTGWKLPNKDSAGEWSAVGYLAAKELSEKLGVPVGLVGCNVGGSTVSCWMPESDLMTMAEGQDWLRDYYTAIVGKSYDAMIADYDAYMEYHMDWTRKMERCYAEVPGITWEEILERCGENRWPGPMNIKSPYRPAGMYHTMLSRITPYTIRGVFWYQSENDEPRPYHYEKLLKAMIRRWRLDFQNPELEFMIVQLPVFGYADQPFNYSWCILREAQMRVFADSCHTGLAVSFECGELGNIHPTDKRQPAHRLALQALNRVYHTVPDNEANGPIFAFSEKRKNKMILHFQYAECGLTFQGEALGFEAAGADGVYCPAEAEIQGDTVVVSSPEVENIAMVRYGWYGYGPVSLYGKNGIPAAPFRTEEDHLRIITSKRDNGQF